MTPRQSAFIEKEKQKSYDSGLAFGKSLVDAKNFDITGKPLALEIFESFKENRDVLKALSLGEEVPLLDYGLILGKIKDAVVGSSGNELSKMMLEHYDLLAAFDEINVLMQKAYENGIKDSFRNWLRRCFMDLATTELAKTQLSNKGLDQASKLPKSIVATVPKPIAQDAVVRLLSISDQAAINFLSEIYQEYYDFGLDLVEFNIFEKPSRNTYQDLQQRLQSFDPDVVSNITQGDQYSIDRVLSEVWIQDVFNWYFAESFELNHVHEKKALKLNLEEEVYTVAFSAFNEGITKRVKDLAHKALREMAESRLHELQLHEYHIDIPG